MKIDQVEICRLCGASIKKEEIRCGLGPLCSGHEMKLCKLCMFTEYFLDTSVRCRKPFKEPMSRHRKDGSPPQDFLDALEERLLRSHDR